MTVRLLSAFDGCPPNSIIALDSANESGMVAAKTASFDLTGGTPFVPKVGALESIAGPFTVRARRARALVLPEGQVLKVTGATGADGEVTRTGTSDRWAVGVGTSLTLGPYSGTQQLPITCSAGSIDAVVQDASLTAAQVATNPAGVPIGLLVPGGVDVVILHMGQSTEHGAVYPQLTYTPLSASGNGTLATIVTTIANNLPPGDVVLGRVSGMTPATYNTSGNVPMTIGGTWPNCTLTYASSGTGAQTVAGTITIDQEATDPGLFRSQRFPAQCSPYAPAVIRDGGYLSGLYDALFDAGYNAHIVNAALGSMSLIQHLIGQITGYNTTGSTGTDTGIANQHFRVRRAPLGNGDLGCIGSLIIAPQTNSLFECTGGGDEVYAMYNGFTPIKVGASSSAYAIDYIQTVAKGNGSGGIVNSSWAGKSVGQTVTDGDLTWTCISANTVTDTDPSIKGSNTTGYVFSEGKYGFDPFGIIKRNFAEGDRAARGKVKKICRWSNAQSDTSATQAWYQNAITALGNYGASRGWPMEFSISIFNPATAAANYDKLQAAIDAALPGLQASWPGLIFKGVNLSTHPSIGRVHGSGNLFLESDNAHVGENIHPQARTARACIAPVAASILAILAA